jgi:hypothetical protein
MSVAFSICTAMVLEVPGVRLVAEVGGASTTAIFMMSATLMLSYKELWNVVIRSESTNSGTSISSPA